MYSIDYRAMGQRVRAKRLERDLTQEKLAEMIDISPSHMGEIERGTSICSLAVIVNIATALDLNLDSLIKGINWDNVDKSFSKMLSGMSQENKELCIKLCENIAGTLK